MIHNHITLSAIANMLHLCGNKTAASFDTLVNKLCEKKMVARLKKLKEAGIGFRSLSSMLRGCGNKIGQTFEALVNKLSEKQMASRLKKSIDRM